MIKVLPTCVAEVVCSEVFLNTWSDFWKKEKTKKSKFKNHQMRKLQVVWQSWLILLLSRYLFSFKMGWLKCRRLNCLLLRLNNANIQSSCSTITSLSSPKALSCTFVRRASAVFLWPVWMKFLLNVFDRNIDQAMAQQLIR